MTSTEPKADQKAARSIEEEIIAKASTGIQNLPMLDVIFSRLATDLTSAMKTRLGLLAEIEMGEISYSPWGRAMSSLDQHAICAVAGADTWEGKFILSLDPGFFYPAFEMQLSGKPDSFVIPKRIPSTIEKRMAKRISQVVLDEMAENFTRISKVRFFAEAIETTQQAGSMQSATAACAIARITIKLEECEGDAYFILPISTLEPVADRLAKMFLGDSLEGDTAWRTLLASRIDSSSVEVQGQLYQSTIPIADLLSWKPGKIIDLGIEPESEVTITCTGIPILHAVAGHRRNRLSLRITREYGAGGESKDAGMEDHGLMGEAV